MARCLHVCRTLTKVLGWPVAAPRAWGGFFRNDAEHRDFVLIGTATGLASAFSTPIGGLLLAIEQVVCRRLECLVGWRWAACQVLAHEKRNLQVVSSTCRNTAVAVNLMSQLM